MSNSVKILLSISLVGGSLKSQGEIEYIPFKIEHPESKKIVKSGKIPHSKKESPLAIRRIKISKEAYEHYISDYCTSKKMMVKWKKMSAAERLEWHMQNTCIHYNGVAYSYHVLTE